MVQQVGGDDELTVAPVQVMGQAGLAGQVQAGIGLVQQQGGGAGQQQCQPADVLALALAQRRDGALRPVGETALRQELTGLLQGLALFQSGQAQGQLFFHGGEDDLVVRVLEHHADALAALQTPIALMDVHTIDMDAALIGGFQAAQQAQQAGLAGAVVADEADAVLGQFQLQAGKDGCDAAREVYVLEVQGGHGQMTGSGDGLKPACGGPEGAPSVGKPMDSGTKGGGR